MSRTVPIWIINKKENNFKDSYANRFISDAQNKILRLQ